MADRSLGFWAAIVLTALAGVLWGIDQLWPEAPDELAVAALVVFGIALVVGVWDMVAVLRNKIAPVARYERAITYAIRRGRRLQRFAKKIGPGDDKRDIWHLRGELEEWEETTNRTMKLYQRRDRIFRSDGRTGEMDSINEAPAIAAVIETRITRLKQIREMGPPNG